MDAPSYTSRIASSALDTTLFMSEFYQDLCEGKFRRLAISNQTGLGKEQAAGRSTLPAAFQTDQICAFLLHRHIHRGRRNAVGHNLQRADSGFHLGGHIEVGRD